MRWLSAVAIALLAGSFVSVTACSGPQQVVAAACIVDPPPFPRGLTQGHILSSGELTIAARDDSVTLIGLCGSGDGRRAAIPGDGLSLRDGDRLMAPLGGVLGTREDLSRGPSASAVFLVFGPTAGRTLEVSTQRQTVGIATFDRQPSVESCPGAPRGFVWVRCGALLVVRIPTKLNLPPGDVLSAGGVAQSDDGDVGFYFEAATRGSGGTDLEIGFRRPTSNSVTVSIDSISVKPGLAPSAPWVTTSFVLRW